MKLVRYLLMTSGLTALGCPLLVDDNLEIVPADSNETDQPVPVGCGVVSLPASNATCPAICDRCEGGQCVFECSTQDACKELELSCPEGFGCKVECTVQAACTKAVVVCSPSYDCDVECAGIDACKEMNVRCSDGNCQMNCTVDGACERATVRCGTGQCGAECLGSMAAPMLECGSTCACNPC